MASNFKKYNIKKFFSIIGLSLLCIASTGIIVYGFAISSDEEDYVRVYSEDDLLNIKYDLKANYKLMNDITFTKPWKSLGSKSRPFTGKLTGNNCTIRNFVIDQSSVIDNASGFFSYSSGNIQKLTLIYPEEGQHFNIERDSLTYGTFVGVNSGVISECGVIGSVKIENVEEIISGGIAGINNGIIEYSSVDYHRTKSIFLSSNKDSCVGGIAGINNKEGNILVCASYVKMTLTSTALNNSNVFLGGTVGLITGGIIQNVRSSGELTANGKHGGYAISAGIAAKAESSDTNIIIDSCYSEFNLESNVNGAVYDCIGYCGGVVGSYHSNLVKISNVYSSCVIAEETEPLSAGLIIGKKYSEEINVINSYYYGSAKYALNVFVCGEFSKPDDITIQSMKWNENIWSINGGHEIKINTRKDQ